MKKILGVGNALVDALYKVDNENIIKELGISLDGMTLIDAERRKKSWTVCKMYLLNVEPVVLRATQCIALQLWEVMLVL